jgi:hypothetical protein
MGERRGVYRVLVVKPEGKRPLGRSRRRWKDNINMHIYIQRRPTKWTYKTASTVAYSCSEIPVCTIHVDIYYTVPVLVTAVFLKISTRV